MLSKEERQAMMAKARAAKQEKQTVESVVAEAIDTLPYSLAMTLAWPISE